MASMIQIRVDDELKAKSDSLFRDLGTDTTARRSEANPYAPLKEEEMLAKLKISREQGQFRDADDVISDMRAK